MEDLAINYWALLICGVASMVVGTVWYGALADPWMKAVGLSKSDVKPTPTPFIMSFLCALLSAYVLAHVLHYMDAKTLQQGAMTAFWMWLGFQCTMMVTHYQYEGKPLNLYLINGGFNLLCLVAYAAILVSWV